MNVHTLETPYPSLFIFPNKPKIMSVSSVWRESNKRGFSGIIGLIRFPSSTVLSGEFSKTQFGRE
jgi:TorA maturation chaperone TorD